MTGETLESFGSQPSVSGEKRLGAVISFGPAQTNITKLVVESRIGISFISAQKACDFKGREVPLESSFDSLVAGVRQTWNGEVFSTVTTTEVHWKKKKNKVIERQS